MTRASPVGGSEAPELLAALVAVPSPSGEETAAARLLTRWLGDRGVDADLVDDNVVAVVEGREPGPSLLLNSHLDTVPPGDGWDTDPYRPQIVDGRLTGRGAVDAKASVAAMAAATVACGAEGLARGRLVFAATCMEETGGGGLEKVLPELGSLDAALVGEPTGLDAAVAQSGLMVLEAIARGRSAHAARAHLGRNALTIAASDLLALDRLLLERSHPFLGSSDINVTIISGGERHNVIPDRCEYTIDVRYTPAYRAEELVGRIEEVVEAQVRVRSDRLRPVETPQGSPLVAALRKIRPGIRLFGSPTVSDWVHLAHLDAVKLGPGSSDRSHTANEWILLDEVVEAAQLYQSLVQGLLSGDPGSSAPRRGGRR